MPPCGNRNKMKKRQRTDTTIPNTLNLTEHGARGIERNCERQHGIDYGIEGQQDVMHALLEGKDRISTGPMTPGVIVRSPEPVLPFGIADESELVVEEHRDRFQRLNRENAKMRRILDRVQELVELAWERGHRARVTVESAPREPKIVPADAVPLADDSDDVPRMESGDGMEGEGKWVRIKNGINMDTCCAANIMPVSWLPQFEVEAGKSRQRYVGATGKIVNNKGQKKIEFMTSEGQGRSMTFQIADVNKILACVAMVCDGGNDFLFRKNGGIVIPEGDLKVVIRPGSLVTDIRRKGMQGTPGSRRIKWPRGRTTLPWTSTERRVLPGRVSGSSIS